MKNSADRNVNLLNATNSRTNKNRFISSFNLNAFSVREVAVTNSGVAKRVVATPCPSIGTGLNELKIVYRASLKTNRSNEVEKRAEIFYDRRNLKSSKNVPRLPPIDANCATNPDGGGENELFKKQLDKIRSLSLSRLSKYNSVAIAAVAAAVVGNCNDLAVETASSSHMSTTNDVNLGVYNQNMYLSKMMKQHNRSLVINDDCLFKKVNNTVDNNDDCENLSKSYW